MLFRSNLFSSNISLCRYSVNICNYWCITWVETWRWSSSNDNIISQHIQDRMAEGKMLDDSLMFDLFNMYGHLVKSDDLMLLDGFPRTIPQMYYFLSKEYKYHRDFI